MAVDQHRESGAIKEENRCSEAVGYRKREGGIGPIADRDMMRQLITEGNE